MIGLPLAIRLFFRLFSSNRKDVRFPSLIRILVVLFAFPVLGIIIISNHIFLLLDWIFFPWFVRRKTDNAVFIIGVPRSATTYVLHQLAKDEEHFTCFKLWELIFAPSIIQKYTWLFFIHLDRLAGAPLLKLSLWLDKLIFKKVAGVHDLGLSKPEEDEILLCHIFASMYLTFAFPGVKELDPVLFFDEELSPRQRKRVMNYYKRCIQRHLFVFNRKNDKMFLSKNPCFISKMASVAETFPEAKLIYMLRSPMKTIPSTISLNTRLFSVFGNIKGKDVQEEKTTNSVLRWYEMADRSLKKNWKGRHIVVPFQKITKEPKETFVRMYSFLNVRVNDGMKKVFDDEESAAKNYKSKHVYRNEVVKDEQMISERLKFIFDGEFANEI